MIKKAKRPATRKIRRNPLARELAEGKFRPRVVKRFDAYKRRAKHAKPTDEAV